MKNKLSLAEFRLDCLIFPKKSGLNVLFEKSGSIELEPDPYLVKSSARYITRSTEFTDLFYQMNYLFEIYFIETWEPERVHMSINPK